MPCPLSGRSGLGSQIPNPRATLSYIGVRLKRSTSFGPLRVRGVDLATPRTGFVAVPFDEAFETRQIFGGGTVVEIKTSPHPLGERLWKPTQETLGYRRWGLD